MVLLQTFTPSANPLGSQWLSALLAVLPVLAMLITLGALRWKAHLAGLFSWGVALIVAITAFPMPIGMAFSSSVQGFLYGLFPISWILLGAIWMYQVTVISGRFDDLRRTFFLISDDPRVLGILIAFCFGGLLEALAGFGAPVAIAAAMLIAIGFGKLRGAITALVANTVPVAFGAVGLPVLMAAKTGGLDVAMVAPVTARVCAVLCLVVPFLMLAIMDGRKGVRECWPFGLFVIVVFGIAAIPAVKDSFKAADVKMAWPGLSGLMTAGGEAAAHQTYTWQWLSQPGFLLAIVAILVGFIYRVPLADVTKELWINAKKMKFSMLTIGLVVALAYVMGDSGQTLALGMFIAGAGAVYPFLAPILGWIGTYVTGSDTSANILFSGLQSSVGQQVGAGSYLGMESMRHLLVGAGASGGVVGKMISPQSLTIAATAIGLAGGESVILRKVFKFSIILLVLMCIIVGLMSTPVLGWMVP